MASHSTFDSKSFIHRSRKACTNCAKVKEKCILPLQPAQSQNRQDASRPSCQRCQRLAKDCTFQEIRSSVKRPRKDEDDGRVQSPLYPTPTPSEAPFTGSRSVSPILDEISVEQRAGLLHDFRLHSIHLPFLVLPGGHDDPSSFERESPFTYAACIAAGAHRHPFLQRRLCKDIYKYVAEAMLVHGNKSLDLVNGLSILTAWYIPHP
jgi:hypothetical protein